MEDCEKCPYQKRCCSSKKGGPRSIHSDEKEPSRERMKQKMKLATSKEIYKMRKQIVEPVFGLIKNLGFQRFHVRGLLKVGGEFSLMCSAVNFKKIAITISTGELRLNFNKIAIKTV